MSLSRSAVIINPERHLYCMGILSLWQWGLNIACLWFPLMDSQNPCHLFFLFNLGTIPGGASLALMLVWGQRTGLGKNVPDYWCVSEKECRHKETTSLPDPPQSYTSFLCLTCIKSKSPQMNLNLDFPFPRADTNLGCILIPHFSLTAGLKLSEWLLVCSEQFSEAV